MSNDQVRKAQPISWGTAGKVARPIAGSGASATFDEMITVTERLRLAASHAAELLPKLTEIDTELVAPVFVVDRYSWVNATLSSLKPHLELAVEGETPAPRIGAAAWSGAQIGAGLGVVSQRVLGNFDPLYGTTGRLLLVAPNILEKARAANVSFEDLALWVCLHEQTHQAQFRGSPWLADFMPRALKTLFGSVFDGDSPTDESRKQGVSNFLRQRVTSRESDPLLRSIGDDSTRLEVSRLMGIMSLLEGHATYIMNLVSPQHVLQIDILRRTLSPSTRRNNIAQRAIGQLLGVSGKAAQYRDGEKFVSTVAAARGLAAVNSIWHDESRVPSLAEIREPALWLLRCGDSGGA